MWCNAMQYKTPFLKKNFKDQDRQQNSNFKENSDEVEKKRAR